MNTSISLRQVVPRSELSESSSLIEVARGSGLIFVSTFFGLGLNFVYSIFLARSLDAERFGLYSLGLAAFNVLSVVSVAGLDSAVLRFIPAAKPNTNFSTAGGMARTIVTTAAVIGSFLGLGLLVLSPVIAKNIFDKAELSPILSIFAIAVPLFAVSTVLLSILQALQDVRWRVFVKYGCEPVLRFSITVALLWLGWDVVGALLAFALGLAMTLLMSFIPINRQLFANKASSSRKGFSTELLCFSMPLLGSLIFASLSNRSDVLVLGYWQSTDNIGYYSAALQTASIISLILGSFDSVATPLISHAIAGGKQSELRQLLRTVLRWSVTISFPLFLVLVLFPHAILSMFGDRFVEGARCLVILASSQLINAASGSASTALLVAGYSTLAMWNSIGLGLLQIGLNILLIPSYGITGAAVGTAGAFILLSLVRVAECCILLKVWPYAPSLWKPCVAASVSFLFILGCEYSGYAFAYSWLIGALVVTYFLMMALLGLDEEDRIVLAHFKHSVKSWKF